MRILAVLGIVLLFSGCEKMDEVTQSSITRDIMYRCSKSGVEYVLAYSGIVVSVDRDGKPVHCEKTNGN